MVSSLFYTLVLQILLFGNAGSEGLDDHSFYVSICNIRTLDLGIEIDCRIFKNDLELGIRALIEDPDWKINGTDAKEKIESYFLARFRISIGDVPKSLKRHQIDYEGEGPTESVSCKFRATYAENEALGKKWVIINQILTEVYDDQVNMVHTKINGRRRSKNLDKDDPYFAFTPL